MTELVEFKKEIKQWQAKDRTVLKQITQEVNDARKRITKLTLLHPDDFARMFPMLNKEMEYYPDFEKHRNIGAKFIPINWSNFLDDVIKRNQAVYNANQAVINAMDNDKIINYIDLERLFAHLIYSELPFEVTFKILGMVVGFDKKYLETHDPFSVRNALYVTLFGKYFDINGNSILNEDINFFESVYHTLTSELLLTYYNSAKKGIVTKEFYQSIRRKSKALLNAYTYIIMENNSRIKMEMLHQEDEEIEGMLAEIETRPMSIAMDKLRRYYRNSTLVEIPENLEEFYALLDECAIDDNERKYIFRLLEEKLSELKENKILNHLNASDKTSYKNALVLLNGMHYSNSDYYPLVQLMDDLKAAGEMLEDDMTDDDKEYIFSQIEDLMQGLRIILEKYLGATQDIESENNIIFLCDGNDVPYVKQDSDQLDGNFYKAICNGIKKIRKDNQRNFKLVMTSDNMSYRLYDILSSKTHISFIEIDNGIYLLVGANTIGQGYDEMVRRVISNANTIRDLEVLLKTATTRNNVLSSHEGYLDLFNPSAPNESRSRGIDS